MGINDAKKLTSTHRQYSDRKSVHMFKTPSIPMRRGKKVINKLEINHRNYNSAINCTVVHKDYKSFVITNKSSYSTSTKSVNRRKRYKRTRRQISYRQLIVTPASRLIFNISKRSREVVGDSVYSNPKRRRLEAGTFQIEPIDDVNELCLKKLFCTDAYMRHHNVNIKFPDQNENLLTVPDDLSEYKKRMFAAVQSNLIDFKSKSEAVTANMNMLSECKNVELKLQRIMSPIDVKFDTKSSTNQQDNEPSTMDGIETQYAATKEEMFDRRSTLWKDPVDPMEVKPVLVVKKESDIDEIEVDRSYEPPSTIYTGQLLWARYQKYPYWPAIVCTPATDTSKGKIHVKFFADRGTGGMIKKENVIEFQGIDSFVQYRNSMESTLSKNDWKAWFVVKKHKAKAWAKAVVEITFVQTKDLDERLSHFDVIVICTLRDTFKNPPSLSQLISEHSSSSQLEAVRKMFDENGNIFDDVTEKLAEISSEIDADALTSPTPISAPKRPQTPAPKLTKPISNHRQSLPSNFSKRRASTRLSSIVQSPLSTSLPIEPEKPQKCKEREPERSKRKEEKWNEFEKALKLYASTARQKEVLFKGLRRGNVCKECLTVDENLDRGLVKCSGDCADHVHRKCAHTTTGSNVVRCHECSETSSKICYACKEKCSESAVRCLFKTCGRYYHKSCLAYWLQTKNLEPNVYCPTHCCHTCVSDDPRNTHFSFSKESTFSRCIKCPTTYHADSHCIPAGVKILTANQHICLRHRNEYRKPINLNWCYICGVRGGRFLCCESCPLTSHFNCLHIEEAGEHYFCDSCETGRHPLHGEVVWAKYSNYRWWPAVIVPPACIPNSMKDELYNDHDLCVRFFGTYEFGWVGRSFVYLYDEGDAERFGEEKIEEAVEQAEKWYKPLMIKVKKSQKVQPLPYQKIGKIKELAPAKLTRSKIRDTDPCSCSPDDPDPCGPTSNCYKRVEWTECSSECPTGDKCQNQCIAKRKYASFKLKYLGDKGFGLIAETAIHPGTMVVEYVGELVTETEYQLRRRSKQTQNLYFMKYGKGLYIDAEKKGNMSRFMNHSCNPNCQPRVIEVKGIERIGLIAMTDINKGEELTFNYEFNDQKQKCYCGEPQCRGFI
ncbi:probable histone-lysine N-methyltransferase Mes-4 isoform X2 [Bradysia coprophila]|uniref:probable histone-lysine N-methyltransferase Mes-4 isoform X2 n=1 Tax=Bradysia coprophila TaxID=38358 RepID=UPI00187DA3E9|nr:probable histone-lysine N-methyltransferase Mes-4 isoform X2 [Bradysia coprophila]